MARKKKDETAEETSAEVNETESANETAVEAKSDSGTANSGVDSSETPTETAKAEASAPEGNESAATGANEPSLIDSVIDTLTSAVGSVASAVVDGASDLVNAVTGTDATETAPAKKTSKRAEKIGTVQSDKMTKTVTVRVDRSVKHPIYRKYVKRRKKFMAHDELGAKTGDKVRIIETRPLSAKKRWRVVEIIQKAER